MADPRPWLESDESTPLERELLLREERARPDPALREEVWNALLGALPAGDHEAAIRETECARNAEQHLLRRTFRDAYRQLGLGSDQAGLLCGALRTEHPCD